MNQIQMSTDDDLPLTALFGDDDDRIALESVARESVDDEIPSAWPTVTLLTRTIVIGC